MVKPPISAAAIPVGPANYSQQGEAANLAVVRQAFERWKRGEGTVFDLLAPDMTWTIEGSSPSAGQYNRAGLDELLKPFNAHLAKPLVPHVRELYADGDRVITLFDASAMRTNGHHYENSYAWFLTMQEERIVSVTAFLDWRPSTLSRKIVESEPNTSAWRGASSLPRRTTSRKLDEIVKGISSAQAGQRLLTSPLDVADGNQTEAAVVTLQSLASAASTLSSTCSPVCHAVQRARQQGARRLHASHVDHSKPNRVAGFGGLRRDCVGQASISLAIKRRRRGREVLRPHVRRPIRAPCPCGGASAVLIQRASCVFICVHGSLDSGCGRSDRRREEGGRHDHGRSRRPDRSRPVRSGNLVSSPAPTTGVQWSSDSSWM